MTKSKLSLVVVFVSLALLALIAFQVYWIRVSFQLKQEQFDKDAKRALLNTIEASFKQQLVEADEFVFGDYAGLSGSSGKLSREFRDSLVQSVHIQITGDEVVERGTLDSLIIQSIDVDREWNVGSVFKAQAISIDDSDEALTDSLIHDMTTTVKLMFRSKPKGPSYPFLDSTLKLELEKLNLGDDYMFGVLSQDAKELLYSSSEDISLEFLAGKESYHSTLFAGLDNTTILSVYFPNRSQLILQRMLIILGISLLLILGIGGGFVYMLRIVMRQKKLSEMKNDFINNMTHELKTPIANIGLSLEALMQFGFADNKEKRDQYLGIAKKENKRLSGLVEQVLKAAAFDRGRARFKLESVNLHELLDEITGSFRLQVEDRKGSLSLDCRATQDVIHADRSHIKSVFLNLLDNANKYSIEAPVIEVKTHDRPNGIEIIVKDQGLGISKNDQQRIFKRFYRVNTGDQHNVKGYGLGLSYVMEVVQFHGGAIKVDSQPGKGSRFAIFLPFNKSTL